MTARIAINGFGRIGRTLFRRWLHNDQGVDIVAINDLTSPDVLAHLLEFDSVHGRLGLPVRVEGHEIVAGSKRVRIMSEPDVGKLPWKAMDVKVVAESTGVFTDRDKAAKHLEAGATKVVVSAPVKGADITICLGINADQYNPAKHHVISNASCTTNCLAPMAKVLHDTWGIENGLMTTIHSYTNDQRILDLPHKDLHRARAAAVNMIPTSTGAAKAIGEVIPALKGKLHGIAVRVPTPNVSLVDLVANLTKPATAAAINEAMRKAAEGALKGVMAYNDRALVSCDFNGDDHSCTFDATQTAMIGDRFVKILGWYDNETGYSARLLELLGHVAKAA